MPAGDDPVPWDLLAPLVASLRAEAGDADTTSACDQMHAHLADRLRYHRIDPDDPRVIYETIVVLGLVCEVAAGARNANLEDDEKAKMIRILRGMAASLALVAPPAA